MNSREVVLRLVEDDDERRAERIVALLAIAFERYLQATVDFPPNLRVYPTDEPEDDRW